jgi:hypothetical protein
VVPVVQVCLFGHSPPQVQDGRPFRFGPIVVIEGSNRPGPAALGGRADFGAHRSQSDEE